MLRRQYQPTAGGEIQRAGGAAAFDHHCPQCRTPQPVNGGAKQHPFILHHPQQQNGRVDTKPGKAGAVDDSVKLRGAQRAEP